MYDKRENPEPNNCSFDIVGLYSSGVKMTLKVGLVPMETTQPFLLSTSFHDELIHETISFHNNELISRLTEIMRSPLKKYEFKFSPQPVFATSR